MRIFLSFLILGFLISCAPKKEMHEQSVASVMDDVITRLYRDVPATRYDSINDAFIIKFLRPEEKKTLASRYQYFSVNVPVIVSLMRDQAQKTLPFWLEEAGFVKTVKVIRNEVSVYDVWQKKFEAGLVSLGINGFDKHRPVYFISVAPTDIKDKLVISDSYPKFPIDSLEVGAFVYHDWSDLHLTEIAPSMIGQLFFTTVRGRAREAHVVQAFRKTPFPSSEKADQIMLTWTDSPHSSINIQWRTDTTVRDGSVQYWRKGSADTISVHAEQKTIQDRMLFNDRYCYRYTAQLAGLLPGIEYDYQIGSEEKAKWSAVESFKTETLNLDSFSFVWFGDTHCFPDSGKLVQLAEKNNKDAAFYSIAGDIVSTGLHRDDWDKLFAYAGNTFARKPLMPVLGNHDRQDGLGAQLYYDLFSLPDNGPVKVENEASYSFKYGNALFVMIDATSEVDDHIQWIEETLAGSDATWKFVMFHFPPYNFEEPYQDIQQKWVPLFDKYHVDMVMGGHIHYYMRSNPMFNGKVVQDFSKGTVYAISISIPGKNTLMTAEPYAVKQYDEGYFYQRMQISGKTLKYTVVNSEGQLKDELIIKK